jgi:two-component system sensor histidine kinase VicK
LQNLLTNAIKYSGSRRWVGIDASLSGSALRNAQQLQLTVRDHGIGIPPSELPHIFKPFYRSPTVTASNTHGTGLGLSITKNLIEAIGGKITVESSPDEGSAFTLHLAVAPAETPHISPSESNA